MELGSLYYDLNIDDKNLTKQLDSADKSVKDFGNNVSDSGDKLKSSLNKAAVGIGAVGVGLTLIAKNATDFTVDTVKNATALGRTIGTTTTEASRLTAAFGRMGVSAESATQVFGIFSKNIVASTKDVEGNRLATEKLNLGITKTEQAIQDTSNEIKKSGDKTGALGLRLKELNNQLDTQKNSLKQSSDGFAKLGVSTVDSSGKQKDFNTILFEVADKFKAMPNGIDKTAAAMDLFGRSGKDMIKVLNLGSDGIKDLEKKADEMGLTLSADTIGKVNALVQSQKELKQQTDALKIAVGTATAPALTAYNETMNSLVSTFLNAPGPIHDATVGVLAFGGPIATGAASLIGFAANLGTVMESMSTLGPALAGFAGWAIFASLAIAAIGATIIWMEKLTSEWDKVSNAIIAQSDAAAKSIDIAKQKFDEGKISAQQFKKDLEIASKSAIDASNQAQQNVNNLKGVGGFFNFLTGARAGGGPVSSGGSYLVGEDGPEIFTPGKDGNITSNDKMGGNNYISIGNIYDRSDADYILRRLDRNFDNRSRGISPA
jgi:hypothetical protein